ncbi:MAG: dTDP-4-dehydrorhamnose reductase [Thermodesulfobacteriota bacterium]
MARLPRVALVGANGMLAVAVKRLLGAAGNPPAELDLPGFDVSDREAVRRGLGELGPELIVNCAAYTDVDGCEAREELAAQVNGQGPGYLAEAARELGAALVHLSTDYVFDGAKGEPYTEEDPPNPLCAYGRSKLLGERRVLESGLDRFYVVRTSWLYGPGGKNFVETIARLAGERDELRVVADQVGCPTYTEDLAQAIFRLLGWGAVGVARSAAGGEAARLPDATGPWSIAGGGGSQTPHPLPVTRHPSPPYGIYHASGEGSCTWHAFAEEIVARLREGGPVRVRAVRPIRTEEYPVAARRPSYSVLSKEKLRRATGASLPPWPDALRRYFAVRSTVALTPTDDGPRTTDI